MHITRYTDYSLRVLIYVGIKNGELVTIKEVADHYGISRNHLMKVVHRLGANGYLATVRGKKGGFRLGMAPEQIVLGDVIRCTEEDFDIVPCFDPADGECRIEPACALQGILREALAAFLGVLDGYTLVDLLKQRRQLARLLDLASIPAAEMRVLHKRRA